jgi:hypothetical protein
MTPDNLKKFERKITAAIKKHLAAGGKLRYGNFINSVTGEMCPISCLLDGKPSMDEAYYQAITRVSGVPFSDKDLWIFLDGFDSCLKKPEGQAKLYLLGRKLRARFLPIEVYNEPK